MSTFAIPTLPFAWIASSPPQPSMPCPGATMAPASMTVSASTKRLPPSPSGAGPVRSTVPETVTSGAKSSTSAPLPAPSSVLPLERPSTGPATVIDVPALSVMSPASSDGVIARTESLPVDASVVSVPAASISMKPPSPPDASMVAPTLTFPAFVRIVTPPPMPSSPDDASIAVAPVSVTVPVSLVRLTLPPKLKIPAEASSCPSIFTSCAAAIVMSPPVAVAETSILAIGEPVFTHTVPLAVIVMLAPD